MMERYTGQPNTDIAELQTATISRAQASLSETFGLPFDIPTPPQEMFRAIGILQRLGGQYDSYYLPKVTLDRQLTSRFETPIPRDLAVELRRGQLSDDALELPGSWMVVERDSLAAIKKRLDRGQLAALDRIIEGLVGVSSRFTDARQHVRISDAVYSILPHGTVRPLRAVEAITLANMGVIDFAQSPSEVVHESKAKPYTIKRDEFGELQMDQEDTDKGTKGIRLAVEFKTPSEPKVESSNNPFALVKQDGEKYLSSVVEELPVEPARTFGNLFHAREDATALATTVQEAVESGLIDVNLAGELLVSLQDARKEAFITELKEAKARYREVALDPDLLPVVPETVLYERIKVLNSKSIKITNRVVANLLAVFMGVEGILGSNLIGQEGLTRAGIAVAAYIATERGASKLMNATRTGRKEEKILEEEVERRKRNRGEVTGIKGVIYRAIRK